MSAGSVIPSGTDNARLAAYHQTSAMAVAMTSAARAERGIRRRPMTFLPSQLPPLGRDFGSVGQVWRERHPVSLDTHLSEEKPER